jgi:hypothetical protein
MKVGGIPEAVVLHVSVGKTVSLLKISPRPGQQSPVDEGAVLEKILLIRERWAEALAARIVEQGNISDLWHHQRGDLHFGMGSTGRASTAQGLTVPTGLEDGKRPDDQEGGDCHVRKYPSVFRHRLVPRPLPVPILLRRSRLSTAVRSILVLLATLV